MAFPLRSQNDRVVLAVDMDDCRMTVVLKFENVPQIIYTILMYLINEENVFNCIVTYSTNPIKLKIRISKITHLSFSHR